jgi:outer membrane protein OmpA-like peptidoglycan-associated protein
MKYYLLSPVIVLVLCTTILSGQTDLKISRKSFKNDKAGFEAAWKNVVAGDNYFTEQGTWYSSAFDEYLKAVTYNGVNPELNYKTGISALLSDNKEKAADYLLKALSEKNDITGDILFFTGRALQYAGRYTEAIDKYNGYLNTPAKKKPEDMVAAAKKYLVECGSALIITKDTLKVEFQNMGSNINSNADDYAELFSSDGTTMFFASRRELSKSSTSYADAKFDENILFSTKNNNIWGYSASAGKDINTNLCETPLYLDPTGELLYIYAGFEGGGDIKVSEKIKGKWKTPGQIPFNINSNGTESSMTVSPDGKEVWYVTDKGKDGLGGRDIYMIKKLDERKWSKPVNAGPKINSPYDEESLRFSEKGDTIWFGSKGHNTIGGFDIFYSVRDTVGEWNSPINGGYPVNTPFDELFYTPSKGSDSLFYLASNRTGTMGGLDIFSGRKIKPKPVVVPPPPPPPPPKPEVIVIRDTVVIIREVIQAPPPVVQPVVVPEPPKEAVLYLIGKIKDSETGDPVMAKIDVIDLSTDLVVATTASSDVDGNYRVKIPAKKDYMIDLRASGFLSDMKRINIPQSFSQETYTLDVSLIKVKVGKKVVLNNILFETGKSILTQGSYSELDRLLNILQDNGLMKIEISGHTDKTGSEPLNFKLSEDRARSVVEYLVKKGIERTRLEYKGFGSLQPIADNATAAGRTKNRRVEFKILEF